VALAEVINCNIILKHPTAPYGEIKNAVLKINGPIIIPPKDFTERIMKQENRVPHDSMQTVMTDSTIFNED
jgi:hypothetical protein